MRIRTEIAGMLVASSSVLLGSPTQADAGPSDALRQQLPMPQRSHSATDVQVDYIEKCLQALLHDWSEVERADGSLDADSVNTVSDYDDDIVWDLIDPDSLEPLRPLASHEVTMHFEKVERGRFAPLASRRVSAHVRSVSAAPFEFVPEEVSDADAGDAAIDIPPLASRRVRARVRKVEAAPFDFVSDEV